MKKIILFSAVLCMMCACSGNKSVKSDSTTCDSTVVCDSTIVAQ